jgi:hypothetical protein
MLDSHFSLSHCLLDAFSFKLFPEFAVLDLTETKSVAARSLTCFTSIAHFVSF